jgi:chromosome segregation ATPase
MLLSLNAIFLLVTLGFASSSKPKVVTFSSKSSNNSPIREEQSKFNKNSNPKTDGNKSLPTSPQIGRDISPGRQRTISAAHRLLRNSQLGDSASNPNETSNNQIKQLHIRLVQKESDRYLKENEELQKTVSSLTAKLAFKNQDVDALLAELKRLRQKSLDLKGKKEEAEALLRLANNRNEMNERKIEELEEEIIQLRNQHVLFFK